MVIPVLNVLLLLSILSVLRSTFFGSISNASWHSSTKTSPDSFQTQGSVATDVICQEDRVGWICIVRRGPLSLKLCPPKILWSGNFSLSSVTIRQWHQSWQGNWLLSWTCIDPSLKSHQLQQFKFQIEENWERGEKRHLPAAVLIQGWKAGSTPAPLLVINCLQKWLTWFKIVWLSAHTISLLQVLIDAIEK